MQQALQQVDYACEVRVLVTSRPMVRSTMKDQLLAQQLLNVINLFQCRCDCWSVGKTTQNLVSGIR